MADMQTRQLGTEGLSVSALGLGLHGHVAGLRAGDEAESIATIQGAVDLGVTLADTAISYGRATTSSSWGGPWPVA